MEQKKKKEKQHKTRQNIVSAVTGQEVVDRYGSAASEYIKSYKGWDPNTGQLFKGLKQISQSRIDPENAYQNYKQQAGFAAEVIHISRENAQRIIDKQPNRLTRTDDLGLINNPQTDILELNGKGYIILGSGAQMKFMGKFMTPREIRQSAKQNINKLISDKYYDKYSEQTILVPSEQYCLIKKLSFEEAHKLR